MPQFVSPEGLWAADADCNGRTYQMTQKEYMGFATLFHFLVLIEAETEVNGFGPNMHRDGQRAESSKPFRIPQHRAPIWE